MAVNPSTGLFKRDTQGLNISALALRHQQLTLFFIVAIAIAGTLSYFRLGQREDPDFTFRAMVIRTLWPGATTQQVDQQITDKLEKKLQEIPYYKRTRSYSKPGESFIVLELEDVAPPSEVPEIWYQVRKKLGDVRLNLPQETLGPFYNDEFGDVFGSIYAFTADGFTMTELRDTLEGIRQELLRIKNVSKIELIGVPDDKIFVELSPQKLANIGVSVDTIAAQLQAQNAIAPGGVLHDSSRSVPFRITGNLNTVDEVRNLDVLIAGRAVKLGDIAKVTRAYADPPTQVIRYRGQDAIALSVSMVRNGDVIQLGRDLQSSMARLKKDLPVGIEFAQVSDQPKVVSHAVDTFMQSLLEAVGIVLVVSFLALGWRSGLVVALTIPLVLLATFMFMRILNIDLHRISTGALIIALGLLVDDAMIAVEMMARRIDEGLDKFAAATFAYTTTAFPMLTGTLITAAGFLPIALARSSTGEYTIALFQVTSIALLISWVAAIAATPLLGFWILKDLKPATANSGVHHEVFDTRFYRALRAIIDWCLAHRWITIATTLGLFFAGVFGMGLTEKQFFPTSDRTEVLVEMWLPEGSSFQATRIEAGRLEKVLAQDKDVGQFVAFIGNSPPRYYLSLNQELFRPNFASFLLLTPDIKARDRVVERVRSVFAREFPGVRARAITTPLGPPVAYPVQFRVQGPELDRLKTVAEQVAQIVRKNKNTVETNLDWGDRSPALSIEVDQDKARALGVSSTAVSRTLAGSVNGATIGQFRERDRLIDVVVRAPDDERANLSKIRELPLMTASGKSVPLTQVATVQMSMEEPIIWRNSRVPTLTVRADIVEGVQAPDVSAQIDPQLNELRSGLPPGYRIEIGGAFEENAKAQASINTGMPLMLGVVLGILMIQLQSFSRVVMVLLTAPFGIVGVALGLLAFQRPFGFVAMLGTIALAGMIMRNTVILVEQIKRDLDTGAPPWIAIREATVRRFRPIVLTAAAAILAMVPLSRDILWGPMAVAIMGGLIVATLLTILAVPAIYAAWYRIQRDTKSTLATAVNYPDELSTQPAT